ncbi:MAG: GNAT family protein [Bilifractor sp.]|nr:GNAT family protein [Bilifractor sp.]
MNFMELSRMKPLIEGTHVILREITKKDTDLIVKWRNNPNVMKNFIFRERFTPEMHNHWLDTKVASGEVIQYIIVDRGSNTEIGSVYFRDIDKKSNSAEYGIFIGEDNYRGKGLGTETAKLFINYGFETLKLHRIFLRVIAENKAAFHAYKSAGFKQEGYMRDMVKLDDEYKDIIFMSILETDASVYKENF